VAALKALLRGRDQEAEQLLVRGFHRVGLAVPQGEFHALIPKLAADVAVMDSAMAALAERAVDAASEDLSPHTLAADWVGGAPEAARKPNTGFLHRLSFVASHSQRNALSPGPGSVTRRICGRHQRLRGGELTLKSAQRLPYVWHG
jgi:hypothetical protein